MSITMIVILGAVFLLLVLLGAGYLKAPPDKAYIISGMGRRRILIGKAGWRIPFLERVDILSLQVLTVDVKTSEAVPTNEFINVMVDGVANVKISSDPKLLEKAAESLLNMDRNQLIAMVTQVLEGNMREIVGSVGLKEMVQDRQGVAKKVSENVIPDMAKLGIELVNFNIQNFRDNAGTIENMGIDNVEQIRKNAQIAKANAQRDIAIASSQAQEEANAVKVETEKKIAAQNADLNVQEAEMKVLADTKKAEADAAYEIQKQEQQKSIQTATVNAQIARAERDAELKKQNVEVTKQTLDAEIRAKADAELYRQRQLAEADLFRRQKDAEAERYEQEQAAHAQRVKAEAVRFAKEQEAEGIKAVGEAEAAAIRAKAVAEAEGIDKKAEAMKKYGEAAVIEMVMNALPEIARNVAEPLSKVDKITMYGEGNSAKLISDIVGSTTQITEGFASGMGLDIKSLLLGALGGKLAAGQDINITLPESKDEA